MVSSPEGLGILSPTPHIPAYTGVVVGDLGQADMFVVVNGRPEHKLWAFDW